MFFINYGHTLTTLCSILFNKTSWRVILYSVFYFVCCIYLYPVLYNIFGGNRQQIVQILPFILVLIFVVCQLVFSSLLLCDSS